MGRDLYVTGLSTFTGDATFDGHLLPVNASTQLGISSSVFGAAYIDDLLLDGSKLSVTTDNTNLQFEANGTGIIDFLSPVLVAAAATFTGDITLSNSSLIVENASNHAQVTLAPDGVTINQSTTIVDSLTTEKISITGLDGSTTRTTPFFKVGSTGVSIDSSSRSTGSAVIYGGLGVEKNIYAKSIYANNLESTLHSLTVSNNQSISGALTVTGPINANGGLVGTVQVAEKANHIAGGAAGRILYQSASNVTTNSSDLKFYVSGTTKELQVKGDIVAFYSSDERFKDNIKKIDNPLEKVLSIGGYTFDWNETSGKKDYGSETGVIAQEIEKLGLPGVVETREDGHLAVRYDKLVPLLIESIKELNDKVEELQNRIYK